MDYNSLKSFFDGIPLIYLANIANDQPHVRVMALIHIENKLWCCSPAARSHVPQLRMNNQIEFCLLAQKEKKLHNIRARGRAIEIQNPAVRENLSQKIPFFSQYWATPTDSTYILYHLDIEVINYHPPGGKNYFVLDLKSGESKEFLKNFQRKPE